MEMYLIGTIHGAKHFSFGYCSYLCCQKVKPKWFPLYAMVLLFLLLILFFKCKYACYLLNISIPVINVGFFHKLCEIRGKSRMWTWLKMVKMHVYNTGFTTISNYEILERDSALQLSVISSFWRSLHRILKLWACSHSELSKKRRKYRQICFFVYFILL